MCPENDFDYDPCSCLSLKKIMLVCVCVHLCKCLFKISVVPSQHSNAVLSKKTNQHAAVPNFLFIHTAQMFAAVVCLQYNTPEFSKRRRRNGKTTAGKKQYTTMLPEYGVCFSLDWKNWLLTRWFPVQIVKPVWQSWKLMNIALPWLKNTVKVIKLRYLYWDDLIKG